MSIYVRFEAEILLVGDEVPASVRDETFGYRDVQQAVQDLIGHTGAVVVDVVEYEERP